MKKITRFGTELLIACLIFACGFLSGMAHNDHAWRETVEDWEVEVNAASEAIANAQQQCGFKDMNVQHQGES